MPFQHQYTRMGRGMGVTYNFYAPNWAWIKGNFERRVVTILAEAGERFGKAIVKESKAGYSGKYPLMSRRTVQSFKLLHNVNRGNASVQAGMTADKFLSFIEYDTRPHWPPTNRGVEGTGIEGWVSRLRVNPRPPFKYPITPYLVAKGIAQRGTKGKKIVSKAFEVALVKFKAEVKRDVRELLRTDR